MTRSAKWSPWLWIIGIAACIFAGCCTIPPAREATSRETAEIAYGFIHLQYEQRNLKAAKAEYYSPDFVQHNPEISNGVQGDQKFIAAREQRDPTHYLPIEQWVNRIDHVLIDGKLFAIHHRLYTSPQDPGRVFMDIWRVEDGKMVEHWDIIQPIPQNAANSNSMTSDLVPSSVPTRGDPAPEAVIRDYLHIGLDENDPVAAAERYIAGDFRQHSPHIADGKTALVEYFKARTVGAAASHRVSYVSHIISDRDLVLVTRHVVNGIPDRGFMYADLFRVRKGKITEHWDVIQSVPAKSVNGNTMW